jgi:hypothetical protein
MATAKTTQKTEAPTVSSLMASMETVDTIDSPLRGRGYDADTLAIREQLEACLVDGKARSFPNVTEDKREDYARKIRTAGAMKNKDKIKVSTRYNKATQKLIWGPAEVLRKLSTPS